jgi:hypothetical protein
MPGPEFRETVDVIELKLHNSQNLELNALRLLTPFITTITRHLHFEVGCDIIGDVNLYWLLYNYRERIVI